RGHKAFRIRYIWLGKQPAPLSASSITSPRRLGSKAFGRFDVTLNQFLSGLRRVCQHHQRSGMSATCDRGLKAEKQDGDVAENEQVGRQRKQAAGINCTSEVRHCQKREDSRPRLGMERTLASGRCCRSRDIGWRRGGQEEVQHPQRHKENKNGGTDYVIPIPATPTVSPSRCRFDGLKTVIFHCCPSSASFFCALRRGS